MIKREKILNYIKEKYGANPEYLWEDTPDAANIPNGDDIHPT